MLLDQTIATIEPGTVSNLDELGIPLAMTGLDHVVEAAGHAIWWSDWRRQDHRRTPTPADPERLMDTRRAWSEIESLALLDEHGIPVVPHAQVFSEEAAAEAVTRLGLPAVVKLVSPDIVHKSDVGGVVLGAASSDDVRRAYRQVLTALEAQPGARSQGALVAPMRSGGIELIVGVARDEQWGLTLAVGLGGVLVHVLDDTVLRTLPVDDGDVLQMLSELRGSAVLDGVRGSKPVDRDALASAILGIARLAERLGDDLESVEVNPLRVEGPTIEALDASVIWAATATEPGA